MKPLLLIGCGGHARSVIDLIETEGQWHIQGLVGLPDPTSLPDMEPPDAARSLRRALASLHGLEAELQRAQEGRIWARVNEEQERRGRAEAERDRLHNEVERITAELNSRNRRVAAERNELLHLCYTVKELRAKAQTYDARSGRKFFEVEPLAEECERLRAELAAQIDETAKRSGGCCARRRATA